MPIEPHPVVDPGADAASHLPAAATYRRLRLAGLTAREAGSLVAHLNGLEPATSGWRLSEVEGLLFVRALVSSGRLRS
jgi:hypothetical protein